MNKFKQTAMLFGILMAGLTSIALVLTSFNSDPLFYLESTSYEIKLDQANNPVQGLTKRKEQLSPDNYGGGDFLRYPVKTMDGNQTVTMFAEGAFIYDEGLIGLGNEGSFGNAYLKNEKYHSRINGLKSITVNYTGNPLMINYSYENEMANGHYRVVNQPLTSGVEYNFDFNYPQYFSINTQRVGYSLINSISIRYSCNQNDEKLPTNEYHDSGYEIGVLPGREMWNDVYIKEVYSDEEAHHALEDSVARHFQSTKLTFKYDNVGSLYDLLSMRRSFSHVFIASFSDDPIQKDQTVEFLNVYWGDRYINNDNFLYGQEDESELAYKAHYDVASMYANVTPENVRREVQNGNSLIRLNYAKTHNLLRSADYNDFPIEKLDDSKILDVYNSEDLWWAAAYDFKPRFPDPDGKPAWIYNEAKKILNSIIYNGMTNFEKIRAVYEWMINNVQYDSDALACSRSLAENTCFFLEGVFERRLAVCDGLSKAFVLLCKMEGLDVKRGLGFGSGGGHAWALARTNPSEPYYIVCPTWGDRTSIIEVDGKEEQINTLTYESFFTSKNYFRDATGGSSEFKDYLNSNVNQADWIYPQSIYMLDKLPGYTDYDYCANTTLELTTILKEGLKVCNDSDFSISFVYGNQEVLNNIYTAINDAGIYDNKWNINVWCSNNLYYITEVTICLLAK